MRSGGRGPYDGISVLIGGGRGQSKGPSRKEAVCHQQEGPHRSPTNRAGMAGAAPGGTQVDTSELLSHQHCPHPARSLSLHPTLQGCTPSSQARPCAGRWFEGGQGTKGTRSRWPPDAALSVSRYQPRPESPPWSALPPPSGPLRGRPDEGEPAGYNWARFSVCCCIRPAGQPGEEERRLARTHLQVSQPRPPKARPRGSESWRWLQAPPTPGPRLALVLTPGTLRRGPKPPTPACLEAPVVS